MRGDAIWSLIDNEGIDHIAAPRRYSARWRPRRRPTNSTSPLTIVTAGAPPSPTIIAKIRGLGANLVHVYGLTETYGPYALCEVKPQWADLDAEEQSRLMARQGVGMLAADKLRVVRDTVDADGALSDVAPDGARWARS